MNSVGVDLFGFGTHVLDHLGLAVEVLRQGQEGLVGGVDQAVGGLVGAVVAHPLKAALGHFGAKNVVDEGMGCIGMRGVGGNELGHDAEAHALGGVNHLQVRVGQAGRGHLTGVHHGGTHLAAQQVVLRVGVLDESDVGGQLQQLGLGLLQHGGVRGVVALAQHLQGHAVHHAVVADDGQIVLQAFIPQVSVAGDGLFHQSGVVHNGLHTGAVGHGVGILGVKELALIDGVHIA